MALPAPANTTCDIYHTGGNLNGAPDIVGVPCTLIPRFRQGQEQEHDAHYWGTHLLLVDLAVDIRDATNPFNHGVDTSQTDYVYIPDRASGMRFTVVWVERSGYSGGGDHKRVYIQRISGNSIVWPSDNV